jgi:hypothetical protein
MVELPWLLEMKIGAGSAGQRCTTESDKVAHFSWTRSQETILHCIRRTNITVIITVEVSVDVWMFLTQLRIGTEYCTPDSPCTVQVNPVQYLIVHGGLDDTPLPFENSAPPVRNSITKDNIAQIPSTLQYNSDFVRRPSLVTPLR